MGAAERVHVGMTGLAANPRRTGGEDVLPLAYIIRDRNGGRPYSMIAFSK
jgi:hypothetical protein